MATSSYDSVFRTSPGVTTLIAGITNACLIESQSGYNSLCIKYLSGGSMLLFDAGALGTTKTGASLVADFNANRFYQMGTEVKFYNGPIRLWVAAVGATMTFTYEQGLTQGT